MFFMSMLVNSIAYAVTDDLALEQEYFPLLIPSQEQILEQKEYSNNYEESFETDQLVEEIRIKKVEMNSASTASKALILPTYLELPNSLPETGAR